MDIGGVLLHSLVEDEALPLSKEIGNSSLSEEVGLILLVPVAAVLVVSLGEYGVGVGVGVDTDFDPRCRTVKVRQAVNACRRKLFNTAVRSTPSPSR